MVNLGFPASVPKPSFIAYVMQDEDAFEYPARIADFSRRTR
jgi:hypothetical protein